MQKVIIEIDNEGYFVCDYVVGISEDGYPKFYTETPLPIDSDGIQLGFYTPKWDGTKWVEGLSKAEIEEIENQPKLLTEIELLKVSQAEQFELILEFIGGM